MFRKHKTDVLVSGAGPVGLFAALALASRGVKTRILDEAWRRAAHSYATALHPRSLGLFRDLGCVDELLDRGLRVDRVAFYSDGERRGELRISDLATEFPFLLVIPQRTLERLLENALRDHGMHVEWSHRTTGLERGESDYLVEVDRLDKVSSGYATATMEWVVDKHLKEHAKFVIGADGNRSRMRRVLDLGYERHGGRQQFAVFEFECPEPLEPEVRVVFDGETTNVMWPLPEGRARWSFQLEQDFDPTEPRTKSRLAVSVGNECYSMVDRGHLLRFLERRAPWFEVPVGELRWSVLVQFERRLAERFGRDRAWIVGDAAHQTGPVGMQSMNVGFLEAADLASRIETALHDPEAVDPMKGWNERWLNEWRRLLEIEGGLEASPEAPAWVRDAIGRFAACIPGSGDEFVELAEQLGLHPAGAVSGTG